MVKEFDPDEYVKELEKKTKDLALELKNAKKDAIRIHRERKQQRIFEAGKHIEDIIHDGGFPDWTLSTPIKGAKWSENMDDTATIIGEMVLKTLKKKQSFNIDKSSAIVDDSESLSSNQMDKNQ